MAILPKSPWQILTFIAMAISAFFHGKFTFFGHGKIIYTDMANLVLHTMSNFYFSRSWLIKFSFLFTMKNLPISWQILTFIAMAIYTFIFFVANFNFTFVFPW
jgi:hypothetical protein